MLIFTTGALDWFLQHTRSDLRPAKQDLEGVATVTLTPMMAISTLSDEDLASEILDESKHKQYAVREFVHALVQSKPFQSK